MGLELYFIAFMELVGSRQGSGLGRIGWEVIQRYCDAHGIVGDQAADMHHHIREMDAAYIKFHGKGQ